MARGSGVDNTNILYGDFERHTSTLDPLAADGPVWTPDEYLEQAHQLPERPLYFENRSPRVTRLILDGPLWERSEESRGEVRVTQTRDHITITEEMGFNVTSRVTFDDQPSKSGLRVKECFEDLDQALETFNTFQETKSKSSKNWEIVEGKLKPATQQDFHNAYVALMAGRADIPRPVAPEIKREPTPAMQWMGTLGGGRTIHKRISPGTWLQIQLSGWDDNHSLPSVSVTGLVRASELPDPEKDKTEWFDQDYENADYSKRSWRLAEDEVPDLFEYPGYSENADEPDPRVLKPVYLIERTY